MSTSSLILKEALSLEMGGKLEQPEVYYSTYGKLNAEKSNVVLVCHALTASSDVEDWWSGLFGTQKVFDSERDFIICINNLGSPYGTSSPKSLNPEGERYGLQFPAYTLRDNARLHINLLNHLGIEKIKLIIGGSCGGNIAQEIAIMLGDKVDQMIVMCCSTYETPWVISIHESQRIALQADPSLEDKSDSAGKNGLRGARAFALPFYRSHRSFIVRQSEESIDKMDDFKASSYVRYQGEKFVNRYDAHCYYKQLTALDTHNIGRGRESIISALQDISASTLAIGFSSDLLIPVVEQKMIAEYIADGTYIEIDTIYGHDAFLIETEKIQSAIDHWKIEKS